MTLATIQFDARYIDLILTEAISQDAVVVQGNIIGVALTSGVQGQKITVDLEGIKRLPAITSIALSIGQELYWDTVLKHVTSITTENTIIIGTGVSNKDLSSDKIDIKLHSFLVSGVTLPPGSVTATSITIFTNKSIDANTTATGNVITNIGASEIEAGIITDQTAISTLDGTEIVLATSGSVLGRATTQQIADLAISSGDFALVNDTSPQLGGNLDLNGTRLFVDNTGISGLNQLVEFRNINNDVSHLTIGNAISGGDVFLQAKGATNANLVLSGGPSGHVAVIDNVDEKRLEFHLDQAITNTTTILDARQTADRTITLPDASGTLALTSDLGSSDLLNDTSPQLGGLLDLNGRLHFNDNTGASGENVLIEFANVNLDEAWLKISNATIAGDVILEVEGSDAARLVIASGANTNVNIGDKSNSKFIEFDLSDAQNSTTTTFKSSQQTNRTITLPDAAGILALKSDIGSDVGSHRTITTYTASLQTEILITNDITTTYDDYIIEGYLFSGVIDNELVIEWSNDNGGSYYSLSHSIIEIGSSIISGETHNDSSKMLIAKGIELLAPVDFKISLKLPGITRRHVIKGESVWLATTISDTAIATATFAGSDPFVNSINAARITAGTGTFSGTVHMKGVVK